MLEKQKSYIINCNYFAYPNLFIGCKCNSDYTKFEDGYSS